MAEKTPSKSEEEARKSEAESGKPEEKPQKTSRAWNALVIVVTYILGTASGVLGDRYITPLLDRVDASIGNDPLYVHSDWPFGVCSLVPLAGMSGDLDPTHLEGVIDTATVATIVRPIVYRKGWIRLTLSSSNAQTLTITRIEPVVFMHSGSAPAWAIIDSSGVCGQSQQRLIDLGLTAGEAKLVDKGEANSDMSIPASRPAATFAVSQADPADVHVTVTTCDGYYEFGLIVHYIVNGNAYQSSIGSREEPYRIVGEAPEAYYVTQGASGPAQVDPSQAGQFPSC